MKTRPANAPKTPRTTAYAISTQNSRFCVTGTSGAGSFGALMSRTSSNVASQTQAPSTRKGRLYLTIAAAYAASSTPSPGNMLRWSRTNNRTKLGPSNTTASAVATSTAVMVPDGAAACATVSDSGRM